MEALVERVNLIITDQLGVEKDALSAEANLLWTVANGMIQSERATPRRQIRRRPLAESFEHAMELLLRGLAAHPGA